MGPPDASYRARFRRVLEHIDGHLDQDLSVERLGRVAAFSKFHFHRQFAAIFGVSAHEYVQLQRLKLAAYRLAFRDARSMLDVAKDSGFESPESFVRAFKKRVGQTPSSFRTTPRWTTFHATYDSIHHLRARHMTIAHHRTDVRVVDFPETKVAAIEHRGEEAQLADAIRAFIDWRRRNRLPPRTSATFTVVHEHGDSHPVVVHYDLCAATERAIEPNAEGVVAKTIPAGRCAVLRHVGSEDALGETVSFLYREWLPTSGEELRDFPLFFQRVSFFPDVPEHEAIVDVFLPLR